MRAMRGAFAFVASLLYYCDLFARSVANVKIKATHDACVARQTKHGACLQIVVTGTLTGLNVTWVGMNYTIYNFDYSVTTNNRGALYPQCNFYMLSVNGDQFLYFTVASGEWR